MSQPAAIIPFRTKRAKPDCQGAGTVSPISGWVADALAHPVRYALLRSVPRAMRQRSAAPLVLGARVLGRAARRGTRALLQRGMRLATAIHEAADRLLLDEEYRREDAWLREAD